MSPTESRELERQSFNAAFYALGLRWFWDHATYERLAHQPCERQRVRDYIEGSQAHLLRAYDAEFLTEAVLDAKRRGAQLAARRVCAPVAEQVGV